jgi:hypothetical protein
MILSEDGDTSKERRAHHRARAPELLKAAGIEFHSHNEGAHLIVAYTNLYGLPRTVDFWPGTGLWIMKGVAKGRGVFKLIRFIEHRRAPCPQDLSSKIQEAERVLIENRQCTTPSGLSTQG